MNAGRILILSWAAFSSFSLWNGCSPAPPDATSNSGGTNVLSGKAADEPWFEEAAQTAGLIFSHQSGAAGHFWMPEMMFGGIGLLDYDGDGWLDVYCVQGGSLNHGAPSAPGNKLYRNLGNGTFEDVTERAGVAGYGYGMGVACADYDGDGDPDIYITTVGPNILYQNNGNGTFTDVTATAGVGDPSWGTSSAFLDLDADGHLDLIVVNYIEWSHDRELECYSRGGLRDYCSPLNYRAPAMDTLYRNRGDGTFENFTLTAGLDKAFGNGLGVTCADFNHDGRMDIYVANDAMPNQLWINQGGGRFRDEATPRGCAVNYLGLPEAGMGVVAVDIQNDSWFDLFVTHLVGEANRLYVNTNGHFLDTISAKGPGATSWPWTGFGVGFADFNHDGELDLCVANGRVKYGSRDLHPKDPYAEPNTLLRGVGQGRFEELLPQGGTAHLLVATSRGAAFGDLDNDGDIDIVIANRDAPLHFLRNRVGPRGNWLILRLLNSSGSEALGAKVRVDTGGTAQWRLVNPNQGYCSSNDPRVHFGLGAATEVRQVDVLWPDGRAETFGPFPANQLVIVRQDTGNPTVP